VTLFAPAIPYHVQETVDPRSDHFIQTLEATCNTSVDRRNHIEIFTNGPRFYPAMLDAIRHAEETINLECYIVRKGEVAGQFVEALCERARAGVEVKIVLDALGSMGAFRALGNGCGMRAYAWKNTGVFRGTVCRASTTARTASCWWWTAAWPSWAVPASPTGG
jgi:phosphatidylserine/phosphatidylglycerophosphate/cardiolipin synthase-like enzyme